MKIFPALLSIVSPLTLAFVWSASSQPIIFDMESVRHRATEATDKNKVKVPVGTAELVEGKVGKAVKFSFTGNLGAGFITASVSANGWDESKGFSFYLKGDGSTNWGGLELIDKSNFALRYGYCFPLDSTKWQKIVVPWRDLIPELAGPLVDPSNGYAPSNFGNFWFGKWFYWRDYPALSYVIDQVALEKEIEENPQKTAIGVPWLKSFTAKLKAKQAVTMVTLGDSLSDKRHWANRTTLWSELLAQQIQTTYGNEVKLVNPAMGGTTLSQSLILIPQWARSHPKPDLVTVWFGYNDWDNGVRGSRFKEYLRFGIERIRRFSGGSANILLLTTCPAHGRWETMKEIDQAVREVAGEQKTGLVDIASVFRSAGNPDAALQKAFWAWDKTHLGTNGHRVVAEAVLEALRKAESEN